MPRVKAVNRAASGARVAVQDVKSSLSFNGTSSKVALTQTAGLPLYSNNIAYTILTWVKLNSSLGAQANTIYADGATAGTSPVMWFYIYHPIPRLSLIIRNGAAATIVDANTAKELPRNQWVKVALVDNNGAVKVYVDGAEDANSVLGTFNYTRTGTFTMNTATWGARTTNTTSFYFNGSLSNGRLYKSALTLDQINQAFNGGEPDAANRVGTYEFDEGAGTTAYDSSGNNNHGTITAGSWTRDTPTKKRKVVDDNMVYNGDFSIAPVVNVPQTQGYRWLDGTAVPNSFGTPINKSTDRVMGIYFWDKAGNSTMMLDNTVKHSGSHSLKLSINSPGQYVTASMGDFNADDYIKVLPNTSYTCSFWMKTDAISGSALGARLRLAETNGARSSVVFQDSPFISTTTGWTQYKMTFTTVSTTRYIYLTLTVSGDTGAATLIMDAWFDDIVLKPTSNNIRAIA